MTGTNWLGIAGGLALFLYGIHLMCDGINLVAGSKLKSILEKLTSNRFFGFLIGILITAIIQSSNATTVMTVGFVNAGLMSFVRASSIIIGANVGSTATGLLIALRVETIAPILAFLGVIAMLYFKSHSVRNMGQIVAGLGVLFIGMTLMKENMKPLSTEAWFSNMLLSFSNNFFIAILAGIIFTAIVQSVSASVGILQAMAMAGAVTSLSQVVYIILGMHIGCCIAAVLASVGGTKDAKRTAGIHVVFNVLTCILFAILWKCLPMESWFVSITDNVVLQIAYFNTFEMLAASIIAFPLLPLIQKLTIKLIPGEDQPTEGVHLVHIRHSDFGTTSIAIAQAQAEAERMFQLARENLHFSCDSIFDYPDDNAFNKALEREETIDFLNRAITEALVEINSETISSKDAASVEQIHHIIRDYERIGDHADNILGYVDHFRKDNLQFSDVSKDELRELMEHVYDIVDNAHSYMLSPAVSNFDAINREEQYVDDAVKAMQDRHIRRLDNHECGADTGMLYVEILTDLERISDHAINIAEAALT